MAIYLLGSKVSTVSLAGHISKWGVQRIKSSEGFRSVLQQTRDRGSHFILEVSELTEQKYLELKALTQGKVKFVVFYQTLKASPVINKLHGSEILLISPEERDLTPVLLKRFFRNPAPLFRRWSRYHMVTNGTLCPLSNVDEPLIVGISNFCAHGVCVVFHGDGFRKKDFVVLEYRSQDGKKIRMQSRVVWSETEGTVTHAGIQFISREL